MSKSKNSENTSKKSEHTWAIFCHLSAVCIFIVPPIGNILGPLVIWLIKKNEMPSVDVEGKSSVNFQISMTIYTAIASILCLVGIGFLLLPPLLLANVILVISAAVKTSNGENFQYPCTIHFIK